MIAGVVLIGLTFLAFAAGIAVAVSRWRNEKAQPPTASDPRERARDAE